MNVKFPAAPSGLVCFSTMIVPRLVFVKVQVMVSPGPTSTLLGASPLSQVALVRSQPEGTVSETV